MNKKIIAIVQARLTSTRLPEKVMKTLAGRPVLSHVFNQLSYSKMLDKMVLATSNNKSDDPIERWAIQNQIEYYRGDLNNVLKRFFDAAKYFRADVIVRITADCPLIDPNVVDHVIDGFIKGDYDYYANINPPTFPDGLDTEVFSFCTLEKAFINAKKKSEIEHVTPYVINHPEQFKIGNYKMAMNYEHYRWTLDNPEDYHFLSKIFDNLYHENSYIKYTDVIKFLDINKSLLVINKNLRRNEGLVKSFKEEREK